MVCAWFFKCFFRNTYFFQNFKMSCNFEKAVTRSHVYDKNNFRQLFFIFQKNLWLLHEFTNFDHMIGCIDGKILQYIYQCTKLKKKKQNFFAMQLSH